MRNWPVPPPAAIHRVRPAKSKKSAVTIGLLQVLSIGNSSPSDSLLSPFYFIFTLLIVFVLCLLLNPPLLLLRIDSLHHAHPPPSRDYGTRSPYVTIHSAHPRISTVNYHLFSRSIVHSVIPRKPVPRYRLQPGHISLTAALVRLCFVLCELRYRTPTIEP